MAARKTRHSLNLSIVSFARMYAAGLVRHMRINISSSHWDSSRYYYGNFHGVDTKVSFRVSRSLPRKVQTCLRVRLHVAYTNQFIHLIGVKDSPYCEWCKGIDNISHALCQGGHNNAEFRPGLLGNVELTTALLGPRTSFDFVHIASRSLLKFLMESGQLHAL